MKKVIVFLIGGKDFYIYKILKSFYYSFKSFIKIYPLIKKDKVLIFFKIIQSFLFLNFNPLELKIKKHFKEKYSFKYSKWFNDNIPVWSKFLNIIPSFNYLEIGTFEGRSAVFISELNNSKKIICVDPYEEYSEENSEIKMSDLYDNAKKNLKLANNENITLFRKRSDDFFLNNKEMFEVIYIDGHHGYEYVKRDFINSMTFLKKDGILIFDDFLWFKYEKLDENPSAAILKCYETYRNELQILFIAGQIIFKRKC